jgi:mannose-6-phosphate isomerase-like protein (cupin superfamily)
VHTRTEELYFILAGTGRITWEGGARLVRSGDLIATPLRARHGLTNIGPDPLAWLVIEVSGPAQSAALAGRALEDKSMRNVTPVSLHIVNLQQAERFDARTVLEGPIRDVRLLQMSPGERVELLADGVEYTTFTAGGRGTVADGAAEIPLTTGVAVTVPRGGRLNVQAADDDPLELFVACLAVDEEVIT